MNSTNETKVCKIEGKPLEFQRDGWKELAFLGHSGPASAGPTYLVTRPIGATFQLALSCGPDYMVLVEDMLSGCGENCPEFKFKLVDEKSFIQWIWKRKAFGFQCRSKDDATAVSSTFQNILSKGI